MRRCAGALRLVAALLGCLTLQTTRSFGETTTYTYDALGRLRTAVDTNGAAVVYKYDNAGNRTQVSNGKDSYELIPIAFTPSSSVPGGGSQGLLAMRDQLFEGPSTVYVTTTEASGWLKADLGSAQVVASIAVAAARDANAGIGPGNLEGAQVEYSLDGAAWTSVGVVQGVVAGLYKTFSLGGVNARYVRLRRLTVGQLAVGEFRLYSRASSASSPEEGFIVLDYAKSMGAGSGSISFNPVESFSDATHMPLSLRAIVQQAQHGTASINGSLITYTPTANYVGADQFTYAVQDPAGRTATGVVNMTISSSPAPRAFPDYYATQPDIPITFNPMSNDWGATALHIVSISPPHSSSTIITVSGSQVTYRPWFAETVEETLTYVVADTTGATGTGTIHVHVNMAPVTHPDFEEVTLNTPLTFNPAADATDDDGPVSLVSASGQTHGTLLVTDGTHLTYTPAAGYLGPDSFTYNVVDAYGSRASNTVTIAVRTQNYPPVAVDDNIGTSPGNIVYADLRANDSDPNNDPLTIVAVGSASHGTVTITGGGTGVSYLPTAGYSGSDAFSYTISDGRKKTASAQVTVTVDAAINNPPTANPDNATSLTNQSSTFDPRLNDVDPNGDPLLITGTTAPAHGTVTVNAGASLTYTPATDYSGTDSFTYSISDGRGGTASAAISVYVSNATTWSLLKVMQPGTYASHVTLSGASFTTTSASNSMANVYVDRPMSTGKFYWEVRLDCGILATGVTTDVNTPHQYGGYGDTNAGVYTWTSELWKAPTGGMGTGPGWAMGAAGDIYGFAFNADTHQLTVYRNNVAGPTMTLATAGSYYPFAGFQNGYSIGGQTCPSGQARGQVRFGPGQTTYTPPAGYSPLSNQASNGSPVAVNDNHSTPPSTPVTLYPLANDIDPEGDPLTLTAIGTPLHGSAVIGAGGRSVTYTPTNGYLGVDSFIYTISDGRGGVATGTISITVDGSVVRSFSISPPVLGKSVWNLATDGALNLGGAGTWTIVPNATFTTSAKAWGGAGGGGNGNSGGGGGGFTGGSVVLTQGVSYTLNVGSGGQYIVPGAPGGGGTTHGAAGGGYTGIRRQADGGAVLIAAGGGGGGGNGSLTPGGAGGGLIGQTGGCSPYNPVVAGAGGTQSAGGYGGGNVSSGSTVGGPFQGGAGMYDSTTGQSGGGGGGGYFGGGGGAMMDYACGGGGGSSYAYPDAVEAPQLLGGDGVSPGAASDLDRFGAGSGGSSTGATGRLILGMAGATSNHMPVAANDEMVALAGQATRFDPRGNDTDPDGDSLVVSAVGPAGHGSVAVAPGGGSVLYTPTTGYSGADSFGYLISDGRGGTASATITVYASSSASADMLKVMQPSTYSSAVVLSGRTFSVESANSANVYVDRQMTTGKYYWEVRLNCGILEAGVTNDVSTAHQWGGYAGYNAGIYTWANVTWVDSDQRDTGWGSSAANDVFGFALDADAHTLTIYRNGTLSTTRSLGAGPYYAHSGVRTGYSVSGQACASGTSKGEFLFGTGATTYAPPAGYKPLSQTSPNAAPIANDDRRAALPGQAITLDPRENDIDPEGDALTIVDVTPAAHGVVTFTQSGTSVTYAPVAGYEGSDSFTYTIVDAKGARATASVTISVRSTANLRSFSISPAVNGKSVWNLEIDGALNLGTAGVWTITPQNTFTVNAKAWGGGGGAGNPSGGLYQGGGGGFAGGSITLRAGTPYTLSVGGGGQMGSSSSAAPIATAIGGAPGGGNGATSYNDNGNGTYVAGAGGGGYSGLRNSGGYGVLIAAGGGGGGYGGPGGAGGGLAGGSAGIYQGADGATQTTGAAMWAGGPGTAIGGGGGGGYYGGFGGYGGVNGRPGGGGGSGYASPSDVTGAILMIGSGASPAAYDDFQRSGSGVGGVNGAGGAGRAILSYTAPPTNTAPTANPDSVTTGVNQSVVINPLANDTDAEGDPLRIIATTNPSHGAVVANADQTITYTPTSGYSGSDSFTYTINDPYGASSAATVTISVNSGLSVDYLIVAGGGAGAGTTNGAGEGGGGAGGVLQGSSLAASGSYQVTVGAGGISSTGGATSGGGSTFKGLTAVGGGAGGNTQGAAAATGGSGGGNDYTRSATTAGTTGQGYSGGGGVASSPYPAGGGGGAGGAGASGSGSSGGAGGAGMVSSISGAAVTYAGGGGGGSRATGGAGGAGGGGAGGSSGSASGGNASGYGSGGGGAAEVSGGAVGGNGSGGVVIIRYLGPQVASGGVVTAAGGYTIHTFTASGTFVVP